jgi:asparaginyl-tRNA synthetase
MVRKPDSVERNEWVELSASAKKKLIKLVEGWRKKEAKLAKEGERLEKEKKDAEERDRQRREEAKSIVLVDDASRGEAKKVCSTLIRVVRAPGCADMIRPSYSQCQTLSEAVYDCRDGSIDSDRKRPTSSSCFVMVPP